jgi:hypothetical protein
MHIDRMQRFYCANIQKQTQDLKYPSAKSSDASQEIKGRRSSEIAKKQQHLKTVHNVSNTNLNSAATLSDQNSCVIVMGIAQSTGGISQTTNTKRIHESFI